MFSLILPSRSGSVLVSVFIIKVRVIINTDDSNENDANTGIGRVVH